MAITDDDVGTIVEEALAGKRIERVGAGLAEQQIWSNCDLASYVENRLGDVIDPRTLDEPARRSFEKRALEVTIALPQDRADYEQCFWLCDGTDRVGTVAFASSTLGGAMTRLSSLHVFAEKRRHGVGRRAIEALQQIFETNARGMLFETNWSWQRPLRWYLSVTGLWVRTWKRDLELCWSPGDPRPILDVTEAAASLAVVVDGVRHTLLEAKRDRDGLVFEDRTIATGDPRIDCIAPYAASTFSLALALAGWPLVRSKELWDEHYWATSGPPEALAYKIELWEAWNRERGWRTETPRIPGLTYPTWTELETKWAV